MQENSPHTPCMCSARAAVHVCPPRWLWTRLLLLFLFHCGLSENRRVLIQRKTDNWLIIYLWSRNLLWFQHWSQSLSKALAPVYLDVSWLSRKLFFFIGKKSFYCSVLWLLCRRTPSMQQDNSCIDISLFQLCYWCRCALPYSYS